MIVKVSRPRDVWEMCDYVSQDYPDSVREMLMMLGVTTPSWVWACVKFRELQDDSLLHCRLRSKKWCSDLANVIVQPQEPSGDSKPNFNLRTQGSRTQARTCTRAELTPTSTVCFLQSNPSFVPVCIDHLYSAMVLNLSARA